MNLMTLLGTKSYSSVFEGDSIQIHIRRNIRVFGMGLISTTGEQHRKQREMLNPVFSIAHMRTISTSLSVLRGLWEVPF